MAKELTGNDISKAPIDAELQRVFTYVRDYFQQHVNKKQVEAYKNYLLYTMDRQVKIANFQTNMKVPVVKQYVDTMYAAIYDNNMGFRVTSRNKKDNAKTESFKEFLDWAFTISGSYEQFMSSAKEALIVGSGFGRIGFHDGNKEITYMKKGKQVKHLIEGEQYPNVTYVSCFNIFYDPTAGSIEESPYAIERKILHIDAIMDMYAPFIGNKRAAILEAQKTPFYMDSHDYNRVKLMAFWNNNTTQSFLQENDGGGIKGSISSEFDLYYKNFLTIDYKGGYSEVLEYWEDDKFILTIDGTTVYNSTNPLPLKKKPYFGLHYNKIPGIGFSHGIGTSLAGIQEVADTIMNLSIDNIKMLVAPMFQKMRGGDTFGDGGDNLSYEPFKVHETNTPDGLKRLELGVNDFSGPNTIDFLGKIAEMSEGINSYGVGYQNKVERSAAGVTAMVESFKARLLPMTDSMNGALTLIAEFWGIIALTQMEENIDVRVVDEDLQTSFVTLNINDFLGRYDVEIDPRSMKAASKDVRKKQLLDMIQLAVQTGTDPSTGEFFIDMKELWHGLLDAYDLDTNDIILDSKAIAKKVAKSQKAQAASAPPAPSGVPPGEDPAAAGAAAAAAVAGNPDSMGMPPAEQSPEMSQILQSALQS